MATGGLPLWFRNPGVVREVLQCRQRGMNNVEIADHIGVKPKTFSESLSRMRAMVREASWLEYKPEDRILAGEFIALWDRIGPVKDRVGTKVPVDHDSIRSVIEEFDDA